MYIVYVCTMYIVHYSCYILYGKFHIVKCTHVVDGTLYNMYILHFTCVLKVAKWAEMVVKVLLLLALIKMEVSVG